MIKINRIIQVNHSAQCFGTKLMSGAVIVHTGTVWSAHTFHLPPTCPDPQSLVWLHFKISPGLCPPFNPTSAPALRPPSLARLDWPLPELSDLSPALLLGDSRAGRLCQRRAHRAGGAQAATAAGSRRPESLEGQRGPRARPGNGRERWRD